VVADWNTNQPDNYNGGPQECLGLFSNGGELQWDDGTCSYAKYFICEKSLR